LFGAAFLFAGLQIPFHLDAIGFGSPYEVATVARNLAATGTFRDPFGLPTGPTAHVAPVYPLLLALLIRVLREPAAIVWAVTMLNACLMALTAALLPALSSRVYGRAGPGIVAGILLAASGRLMPQWEVAFAAALVIGTTFAFLHRGPLISGVWAGICLLANPVSLPVLVLLGARRGRRFAVVSFIVAAGFCTPWIARNQILLGSPFFIRDNFGLEFYISNNDRSASALIDNEPLWSEHPNQNRDEAAVVAKMGEGAYNRMRLEIAAAWVRSHPMRFLQLTRGRAWNYWFPAAREGWPSHGAWIITLFGAVGAWMCRRNREAMVIAAVAAAYSLPFLLIQTVGRYRYPSLWASALLAGYAVYSILERAWWRFVPASKA
jgi:hypothetical protein